MTAYQYSAINQKGRKLSGTMEADSSRQIRQTIRDQGLIPLSVRPVIEKAQKQKKSRFSFSPRLSQLNLALITRQLSILIQAGLPIEEALKGIAKQTGRPRIRSLLLAVRSEILAGQNLASSLDCFPNAFPLLYRATVTAGEHSGYLDKVLEQLASYTEMQHESQRNIQLSMLYPVILLMASLLIITALLAFVVPSIVEVFADSDQELPFLTAMLIAIANTLSQYGLFIFFFLALFIWAFYYFMHLPNVQLYWHKKILYIPLIKKFSRDLNTARFTATMAILTQGGVQIVEAMKIGSQVLSNKFLQKEVMIATQKVREGGQLSSALSAIGHFPPLMLQMIASGEISGSLDMMLSRVAEFQRREIERRLATFVKVAEPLMILFMGALIMMIVLAILLPILNLNALVL